MAQNNPFINSLKYAVKAVQFFNGKNIPLIYFKGCEEAKSVYEADPRFTKFTN
jgi:hypothetical protein